MEAPDPGAALVSIVLPTYKRAHVLPLAIRSVLAQSYTNWELIVVDDNSPDDTAAVVASFADPRIRYVRNEPNLKLPRALNRGFSLARGDYLTWTSDDNLFAEQAIAKMVARLQAGDCDFVYADYWLFSEQDAQGQPVAPQRERLPGQLQLHRGNHIGACFMYTRRLYEAVGDYDPELFLVEDYDYFIRAARAFRFAHIATPLYHFRRDDDTLYLSRFAEVKASDVLVRYRNGIVDRDGLLDAVVALVRRKAGGLKPAWLGRSGQWLEQRSSTLARWHAQLVEHWLRRRLGGPLKALLDEHDRKAADFRSSRDAIAALMQRFGTIEY